MYLIIGSSGFLGQYAIKNVLELTNEKIVATYSKNPAPFFAHERVIYQNLDVSNPVQLQKISKMVDEQTKIIYLAAYHHPDRVEENPELAWEINIIALANIVSLFARVHCFYYTSTDTVYGEGPTDFRFTESSPLNPVNLYGRHKALAEQITLTRGFNVVRFPFIFGPSLVEGRPHFYDHVQADIRAGQAVEMFHDSYRSTLSFNQCAKYMVQLIQRYGSCEDKIINIAGDEALSKYDVGIKLCEKYNLDKKLVRPISIVDSKVIFKAKRASTAVLDNTKIKQLLNLSEMSLEL